MTTPVDSLPLPARGEQWSLFLDFDGTLAEIAPRPEDVTIAPELPTILGRISTAFCGAVALVSGRPIALLDRVLGLPGLAAAGLHGLELRLPGGVTRAQGPDASSLVAAKSALRRFVQADPGLLVEDKGRTVALHFRGAPKRAGDCERIMNQQLDSMPGYEIITGKMVLELKPGSVNKGSAVRTLMTQAPFAGRRAVFVGDDVTDEDGFDFVQRAGGIAIKVGPGDSRATNRAPDVATVVAWLDRLAPAP